MMRNTTSERHSFLAAPQVTLRNLARRWALIFQAGRLVTPPDVSMTSTSKPRAPNSRTWSSAVTLLPPTTLVSDAPVFCIGAMSRMRGASGVRRRNGASW